MSTLDATYVPISEGLSSYGGGPESAILQRLTAKAFQRLASQGETQVAINDLYTLHEEALAGDHGVAMSTEALQIGKRFLLAWPKTLPAPEIALDQDGEVLFDWASSHRRLFSVSLRADGRISFAGQLGARRTLHGTEAFDDAVPEPIVEAVKSLYAG